MVRSAGPLSSDSDSESGGGPPSRLESRRAWSRREDMIVGPGPRGGAVSIPDPVTHRVIGSDRLCDH
eukprot:293245-Hanusia_phi.AAC.1